MQSKVIKIFSVSLAVAAMVTLSRLDVGQGYAVNVQKPQDAEHFPQLLTYDAMMQLSVEQRQSYLTGLASMLVEMESTHAMSGGQSVFNDPFGDSNPRDLQSRGAHFLFDFAVAPALAQTSPATDSLPNYVPRSLGRGDWECTHPGTAHFDHDVGTCAYVKTRRDCDPGFETVTVQTSANSTGARCVPSAAWSLLGEDRKRALQMASGAPSVKSQLRGDSPEARAVVFGGQTKASLPNLPAANSNTNAAEPAAPTTPTTPTTPTAPAIQVVGPDGKPAAVRLPPVGAPVPVPVALPPGAAATAGATTNAGANATANTSVGAVVPAPVVAPAAAPGACPPQQIKCEGTWAQRRDNYYRDTAATKCVFAGNISDFPPGARGPGRCSPTRTFSFVSNDTAFACRRPQDVICNPLIFSVKKDKSPFCVPAKGLATQSCDRVSTPATRRPDFVNQNISGLRERWNAFRADFNQVCRSSATSRAFHCGECQVISKRLTALNALATGNSCGGDMLEYDSRTPKNKPKSGRGST